jgi:hypothetical protein
MVDADSCVAVVLLVNYCGRPLARRSASIPFRAGLANFAFGSRVISTSEPTGRVKNLGLNLFFTYIAELYIRLSIQMVRSTIIVRASDALPLAASVDDEQVGHSSTEVLQCH